MSYEFDFTIPALKEWQSLDKPIRERIHKKLVERLKAPRNPAHALTGELHGTYKIKDTKSGNRLVYCVEDDQLIILVIAVGKREHLAVYKLAAARLKDL